MAWPNECTVGELLGDLATASRPEVLATRVIGVSADSRKVREGDLFICVRGETIDGHDFVRDAIARGARAVATERDIGLPPGAPEVRVPSGRRTLARAADRFFGSPSRELFLVGITGTNGKTTVSYLARAILEASGRPTALMGTVEYALGRDRRPAPHTTPDALELQALLREAVDGGAKAAVMEVSSHGLAQDRVAETAFDIALFTNLSHDHLDYHGSMELYREAKASFFRADAPYGEERRAVLNVDDPMGRGLVLAATLPVVTFGVQREADVRVEVLSADLEGLDLRLSLPGVTRDLHLAMAGRVNASNAAAAAAAGWVAGAAAGDIVRGLESVAGVPGRMEAVRAGQPFSVIVDFAHTPDALERLLLNLRGLCRERMTIVFGCGGDRDAAKRPIMGEIACRLADRVIITNDNPRSEDPGVIASAIRAGCKGPATLDVELDRERAITLAVRSADAGDLVIIAGKGHERFQIVGRDRRPFDDREVAGKALGERGFTTAGRSRRRPGSTDA